MSAPLHSARKHSKFSASGADRWFNCPGSVALSEGLPDKDSKWSIEGTQAHEVLESILTKKKVTLSNSVTSEMMRHGTSAAAFILNRHAQAPKSELLVETRISLPFIHPDMFGTFDGAVVQHFGMLDVFDYKYGQGHAVSPGTLDKPNLQMSFYGIGLAAKYDWNFRRARLWIIQPRIKGYDGPLFLEMGIMKLKAMVPQFQDAVARVERQPNKYVEGGHCHWCKAKAICPLKQTAKQEKAKSAFAAAPIN